MQRWIPTRGPPSSLTFEALGEIPHRALCVSDHAHAYARARGMAPAGPDDDQHQQWSQLLMYHHSGEDLSTDVTNVASAVDAGIAAGGNWNATLRIAPETTGSPDGVGTHCDGNGDAPRHGGSLVDSQEEANKIHLAMRTHPKYPALLDAYIACRTVGADHQTIDELRRQRARLLIAADAARSEGLDTSSNDRSNDHSFKYELDRFMSTCTEQLLGYARDVRAIYDEADALCREFEQRIAGISAAAADLSVSAPGNLVKPRVTTAGKAVKGSTRGELKQATGSLADNMPAREKSEKQKAIEEEEEEEVVVYDEGVSDDSARLTTQQQKGTKQDKRALHNTSVDCISSGGRAVDTREVELRQSLKRKYATAILSLKEEFLRKRKKGKLPQTATMALKKWWSEQVVWPYPSEEDKQMLGAKTGLSATQINNWFINQRKRHWHKLFRDTAPPTSAEEATEALTAKYGTLEAALEVARSS